MARARRHVRRRPATERSTISGNGAELGNVGATIRADALAAIGLDPAALAGGVREVAGFGGRRGARHRGRITEEALDALTDVLRARLDGLWRPDPVVRGAMARFAEDPQPRVADVARASGVSPPALVARFRRATGVTPKAYADLMRLHGLLERLTDGRPRHESLRPAKTAGAPWRGASWPWRPGITTSRT